MGLLAAAASARYAVSLFVVAVLVLGLDQISKGWVRANLLPGQAIPADGPFRITHVTNTGGAFGLLVLANLSSQRAAQQIFPFVILPQFFLAGIFNPIHVLPWYLEILSRISPLRYAVDLTRNVFYQGRPEYPLVVLDTPVVNGAIMAVLFAAFLITGTFLFVRSEQNR